MELTLARIRLEMRLLPLRLMLRLGRLRVTRSKLAN
jgi:hypothetical protein